MSHFPGYPAATSKLNGTVMMDDHPGHHDVLGGAVNFLQLAVDTANTAIGALQATDSTVAGQITALQAEDNSLQAQINAIGTSGSDATAVAAALAAHAALTSSVHGIADTSKLVTSPDGTVGSAEVVTRSVFNGLVGSYVTGRVYLVRP